SSRRCRRAGNRETEWSRSSSHRPTARTDCRCHPAADSRQRTIPPARALCRSIVARAEGGKMLATTAFELAGFRVVRSIGVVRGITVRTRALPVSIVGGLRTLFGGRAGIFANLCEAAREEAYELMLAHAKGKGANAVIGVRYDTGPMVG